MPSSNNNPELTVSELSSALRRALEVQFGFVRIKGEISGYRGPHSSGHAYFSLKDSQARIDAIIWRPQFGKLKAHLKEGLEVIASGKITTFAGKSSYQIIIESLEPAGIGALMALLEERRARYAAAGLFALGRKKPIPFLPNIIGIITSPTGAVIRDMVHRLSERFPREILLWPVRVQGESAAEEVAAAIDGFNKFGAASSIPRPDVLIIARGGGSLEDLWTFNEEIVLNAAAHSSIPIISAIGHETDWTLLDHIADLRAPTPSAAAEKSVPVRLELLSNLKDLTARHYSVTQRSIQTQRNNLRALSRALPGSQDIIAHLRQRLDRASDQLQAFALRKIQARQLQLERLSRKLALQSPHARLTRFLERLSFAAKRLQQAQKRLQQENLDQYRRINQRLFRAITAQHHLVLSQQQNSRQRLHRLSSQLKSQINQRLNTQFQALTALAKRNQTLSYHAVLNRGFAVVRDQSNNMLTRKAIALQAKSLDIEFADGHITTALENNEPPSLKKLRTRRPIKSQGILFE